MNRIAYTVLTCALALTGCDNQVDDFESVYEESIDGKADRVQSGRFELFAGRDGKTYFHLLANNGQKVLGSQGYESQEGAENGIASVRDNGVHADAYQLHEAQNGQWYFNLLAGNWEVIGSSELYVSKSNAERARDAIVTLLDTATVGHARPVAKFQIFRGLDTKYYFHIRAANGEIVLQSQAYTRRASAQKGTASVRENGKDVHNYQVRDAANGEVYFVLVAQNNEVIGVSETYPSRAIAEDAISALRDIFAAALAE